ncbi:MAG: hypothetical protein IH840_12795 [Candidatus Heimdallarchaeota archaeon]|nr:hypothetical protein [Candidatus Heimdallarchaeota archaeon]
MRRYRRGQLFLIEIIVALSILFVLIAALFSTQQFSPPADTSNLDQLGHEILSTLVDSDILFTYLEQASYSFYTIGETIFDNTNETKVVVFDTIESGIPLIAGFKAYAYQMNAGQWDRVDIVNFEAYIPSGSETIVNEYYTPGFNGVFVEYKFQLLLWFEVQI